MVEGTGYSVQCTGHRVQGTGYRVQGQGDLALDPSSGSMFLGGISISSIYRRFCGPTDRLDINDISTISNRNRADISLINTLIISIHK